MEVEGLGFRFLGLGLGCGGVASIRFTTSSRRSANSVSGSLMASTTLDSMLQDMRAIVSAIENADDRTIAIVAGAYMEDYSGQILRHWLPGLNNKLKQKVLKRAVFKKVQQLA